MRTKVLLFVSLLFNLTLAMARADTPLTIGTIAPGPGGPCYDDTDVIASPPRATGMFTLPGVAGTGSVTSSVAQVADNIHGRSHLRYDYSVDMTGISPAANHCIRLLVHFGTPHGCSSYDVLQFTGPGVTVASASKAPYGDVTFVFNSGCLVTGQKNSDVFNAFGRATENQCRDCYRRLFRPGGWRNK